MYDAFSYNEQCRNMVLNEQEFLITEVGTTDEDKIRLGVNCNGFGRIRLFESRNYAGMREVDLNSIKSTEK